ncbi:phosphotransferase family protein [Litchfieldia alkalitelluris]|uniref:phosphotransferase family protein n=1 Tax=Litchfieldia alkalitelluris TaxID=304268 RepID=UPI000997D8BD|nr:phosphotransferase [Litchfieldia alkalitelluris]
MMIDKFLEELQINPVKSVSKILTGNDSAVWKVEMKDDTLLGIRAIERNRINQFLQEKSIMRMAQNHGIKVPKVYKVKCIEEYAVMSLEWVNGKTIFDELRENPKNACNLGSEFGRSQATLHQISFREYESDSWLSSKNEEEQDVLNRIRNKFTLSSKSLLHLDFHPLNVLVDENEISGIIDWTNASVGDPRFDLARTYSILKIEGYNFQKVVDPTVFEKFGKGWIQGYESLNGSIQLDPLFNEWAGVKMRQDLQGKRPSEHMQRIESWINHWRKKGGIV